MNPFLRGITSSIQASTESGQPQVDHTSRFGRNQAECIRYKEELRRLGKTVVFVSQGIVSGSDRDFLAERINETLDEQYSRNLSAAPYHPQTNGKLERYHQSIKHEVNQIPYEVPGDLEVAITGFVDYYNHRRYHKVLSNVPPDDVLNGWREEILIKVREVKAQTLASRKRYNRLLRESNNTAISP